MQARTLRRLMICLYVCKMLCASCCCSKVFSNWLSRDWTWSSGPVAPEAEAPLAAAPDPVPLNSKSSARTWSCGGKRNGGGSALNCLCSLSVHTRRTRSSSNAFSIWSVCILRSSPSRRAWSTAACRATGWGLSSLLEGPPPLLLPLSCVGWVGEDGNVKSLGRKGRRNKKEEDAPGSGVWCGAFGSLP